MYKKLNIIIPMYNAEKFIDRTINSIIQSNLPTDFYDILIVNDGSTDKSQELVESLIKNISNLHLINQENGGASAARNSGIRHSDCKYIWFVDSDDRVEKELSIIPQLLEELPDIDVFLFSYNWINENGKWIGLGSTQQMVKHNETISGRDAILQGYTPGSVCGLIIRKDYLENNSFKFVEGMTHEDVIFTFELFAKAHKVYFSNEIIYNYNFRTDSVTKATNIDKLISYNVDEAMVPFYFYKLSNSIKNKDPELSQIISQFADNTLFGCVYNLFRNKKKWKPLGVNQAVIQKLKDNQLYPLRGPFNSWKKRIMSILLNIEPLIS